jgi:hypothetical protein
VGLPAFVGLAGVLWSASELIRTRIRGGGASPLALWLCLAFVTEVLFSALSGRDYRHYFINWMPWIAFGAAMLFSRTFSPVADTVRSALLPVTFGLVLGLGLLYRHAFGMYANAVAQLARGSPPPQISEPVPDYVSTNTAAGERVLVWGGHASINFLSGREEPTPYFFYPLFVDSPVTERMSAQFLRDLQSNPPALIVDPAAAIGVAELVPLSVPDPLEWYEAHGVYAPPYLSQFFGFLEAHYMRETTVESMVIYRLRGQQAVKA